MVEKFTGTIRKNKANNHKYVTIPKAKKEMQEGDEVIITKNE